MNNKKEITFFIKNKNPIVEYVDLASGQIFSIRLESLQ